MTDASEMLRAQKNESQKRLSKLIIVKKLVGYIIVLLSIVVAAWALFGFPEFLTKDSYLVILSIGVSTLLCVALANYFLKISKMPAKLINSILAIIASTAIGVLFY